MSKLALVAVDGAMVPQGAEEASPGVCQAVGEFLEAGHRLVPVTHRALGLMGGLATQLGLCHLGVLDGGATIYDFEEEANRDDISRWLDPAKTGEVLRAMAGLGVTAHYGEKSQAYTGEEDIADASPSVSAIHSQSETLALIRALAGIEGISSCLQVLEDSNGLNFVQVVAEGVDRSSGVASVLADPCYSYIAPKDIMALGAGPQDMGLLAAIPMQGWRVATSDSGGELRKAAQSVVASVGTDGLAQALEVFMSR